MADGEAHVKAMWLFPLELPSDFGSREEPFFSSPRGLPGGNAPGVNYESNNSAVTR